jgi:hypothetical protein
MSRIFNSSHRMISIHGFNFGSRYIFSTGGATVATRTAYLVSTNFFGHLHDNDTRNLMAREKGEAKRKKNVTCEHRNTPKNVMGPGAHLHFVASQSAPRRAHGRHDHVNVSVSVLRRPHKNGCAYVYAVGCSTAHGVRILQLHPLAISLCRHSLLFRVSAAEPRGIYEVANERVRGVLTPVKRGKGLIRGQEREDGRGSRGGY